MLLPFGEATQKSSCCGSASLEISWTCCQHQELYRPNCAPLNFVPVGVHPLVGFHHVASLKGNQTITLQADALQGTTAWPEWHVCGWLKPLLRKWIHDKFFERKHVTYKWTQDSGLTLTPQTTNLFESCLQYRPFCGWMEWYINESLMCWSIFIWISCHLSSGFCHNGCEECQLLVVGVWPCIKNKIIVYFPSSSLNQWPQSQLKASERRSKDPPKKHRKGRDVAIFYDHICWPSQKQLDHSGAL